MKKTSIITLVLSIILLIVFIYSLFFAKTKYEIRFVHNDETVLKLRLEKGEKITLPEEEPAKEGYTFVGWYYGSEKVDENTVVESAMRITPKFEEKETTAKVLTNEVCLAGELNEDAVQKKLIETGCMNLVEIVQGEIHG